jgi:hypothetical protein
MRTNTNRKSLVGIVSRASIALAAATIATTTIGGASARAAVRVPLGAATTIAAAASSAHHAELYDVFIAGRQAGGPSSCRPGTRYVVIREGSGFSGRCVVQRSCLLGTRYVVIREGSGFSGRCVVQRRIDPVAGLNASLSSRPL